MNDIMQYIYVQSRSLPDIQPEYRLIYHYTNVDSAYSILTNNSFHATDASFLIDAKEIELINDLLNRIDYTKLNLIEEDFFKYSIENMIKYFFSYNSIFVISFCTEDTHLPMWNSYTDKTGYSLGFKTMKLRDSIKENKSLSDFSIIDGKIIYDEASQLERVYQIIKGFDNILVNAQKVFPVTEDRFDKVINDAINILVQKVFLLSIFFKSEDFKFENEYRFAFISNGKENNAIESVNYKVRNGYFTPYLNVSFPRDTLFHVLINPKMVNKDLASFGLEQFLKKQGYTGYVEKTAKVFYRY